MIRVRTDKELNKIKYEEIGYILNIRPERNMVHHASCSAVSVSGALMHPKFWGDDPIKVQSWLKFGDDGLKPGDVGYGWRERGWVDCGLCGGLDL